MTTGGNAGSSPGSLVASSTEGSPPQVVDVGTINAPMQVVSGTTQSSPTDPNASPGVIGVFGIYPDEDAIR